MDIIKIRAIIIDLILTNSYNFKLINYRIYEYYKIINILIYSTYSDMDYREIFIFIYIVHRLFMSIIL